MNKIRIATNDMTLTVKMSDEQANVWFGTLTRALHHMKFHCECGRTWFYHTNAEERIIEQNCLACGMPMQAEQDKNGDYSPL